MPSPNIGTWLACSRPPWSGVPICLAELPSRHDRQLIFAWTWIRVLNVVVVAAGSDASS